MALKTFASVVIPLLLSALACRSSESQKSRGNGGAHGGSAGTRSTGGGGGTAGAATAGTAGTTTGGVSGCPPRAIPSDAPSGFEELPLFGCEYRVYVPPSPAAMPSRIAWKQCGVKGPEPYECREMVVEPETDGQLDASDAYVSGGSADVSSEGSVTLAFRRIYENASGRFAAMNLIAEADGAVRQAAWQTYDSPQPRFWFAVTSSARGMSAWTASDGIEANSEYIGLGGDVTALRPPILFGPQAGRGVPWAGPHHFAEFTGSIRVVSWSGNDFGTVSRSLEPTVPHWAGDVLYWTQTSPELSELWMWTESRGAFRLHGYGDDTTKSPASLGTDGVDLVWLEGSEREVQKDVNYPTRAIYTSPFVTDPEALAPRRVRSFEPPEIWRLDPVVGCGRAAFTSVRATTSDPKSPTSFDILLVRLSDGVSWTLTSPNPDPGFRTRWSAPIALTCDELFAGTQRGIRRIRLDSLDAGSPPD